MLEPIEQGVVTVRGTAEGFAQEITAGRHQLIADEPVSVSGTDRGPTPYDLLLAALRRLNIHDNRAVCATEGMAAHRREGAPAAHMNPRRGLRRL